MSLNFCDLLVVGSDLSGLMAATLLAKRGMNVLILDDDTGAGSQPNLVTGLGSRAFKSLLGKLMIPDSKLSIVHENKVPCQVIFPRNRLDLSTSRPAFLKEIGREFPQEKEILEELLGEIDRLREGYLEEILTSFPIEGAKERKRFIKWFRTFPDEKALSLWGRLSPPLQCLMRIQLKFFSRGVLLDPLILQMLLFLPPEGDSTFSIRGGMQELKKLFFDKLDYFGGMVHPLGVEPFEVITKGREVRAIQLGRYNFPTRCRFLLGNTNIQNLYQHLPTPFLPTPLLPFLGPLFGRLKKRVSSLHPLETRLVVPYLVSKEVLPAPMKENVISVLDPTAPLLETNYLELNFQPLAKGKEGFDTLLSVSFGLPGQNGFHNSEELIQEIDKKIRRLIPFANQSLQRVGGKSSDDDLPLFPTGPAVEPEAARLSQVSFPPSPFFPTVSSPFRNLFAVGPNLLDWIGMEGKMLASLRAVDLIWSQELKSKKG